MKSQTKRRCGQLAGWLVVSLISIECHAQITSVPEVTILQGTLQGFTITTNSTKEIYGFLGIPYAEPPIENLRFAAPVAASAWSGDFNATDDGPACPQIYRNELFGDEDCLSINVYTPKLPDNNSALLPTMFYIYGGAFKTGYHDSIRYGPKYLVKDDDVVLAVPNYRGGPLGYLSTGDEAAPGNFALKDLVLALTWVQENIAFFGGDPDRVTIFGQSSGGMIVHYLSLSDLTEGLFHAYITQSGSALTPNAFVENDVAVKRAFEFGTYFNCSSDTSTELVECLRAVDAANMISVATLEYSVDLGTSAVFLPTNEPDLDGAFITDTPQNLIAAGKTRDLPWIAGVTMDEGLGENAAYHVNPDLLDDFIADIDNLIPIMCGYAFDESINQTVYTEALKAYYLNDLTANRSVILENMTKLVGDAVFVYPLWSGIQPHLATAKNPVYMYIFNYLGVFSFTYIYAGSYEVYGVAHGDDIIYRFPQTEAIYSDSNDTMSASDMEMVDIAVELWTSFAINGTPSSSVLTGATWEPYSTAADNFLRIGNRTEPTVSIGTNFFHERMLFWDQLTASNKVEASSASTLASSSRLLSLLVCSNVILFLSRLEIFANKK